MRLRLAASFVLASSLPMLTACKTTPKQRLQGKWIGEKIENFHRSQVDRASGWVGGTSFEFNGARVTVTIPAESPRKGTYKIAKVTADELLVTFLRPHGAEDQVAFQFEGDNHLRWKLGDGRSIILRKAAD